MFKPFEINGVRFKNRILRSSIGGRTSYYDGTVSSAWKNFEKRFAANGVGGIVSATITVDERRWSPLEYPKISDDRFVAPLRDAIQQVQAYDCRYILQIGDPGAHTQTSLFAQSEDGRSASDTFDLLYGYRDRSTAMSRAEIAESISHFARAAARVRAAGCDGLEITASKGYLIHQFLNPATNRRDDEYGGSTENRFRFLREVVTAVRREIGADFLFGVRLSAIDCNHLPINVRWPPSFPLKSWLYGNGLPETLYFARELESLGVDYLHVSRGFGFINPKEVPGRFPAEEARIFFNSNRHLGTKAWLRAALVNAIPLPLLSAICGIGWKKENGESADWASHFRSALKIPVIANGGMQDRDAIEGALRDGKCDLVSMARPLLANPDLLDLFRRGERLPARPCTQCNRCAVATTVFPLGCYDRTRFASQDEMEAQILAWSATHD
jgi:2,4-dienoyl-CoA reductase (NADPH2)